jgi:hypothetical protein
VAAFASDRGLNAPSNTVYPSTETEGAVNLRFATIFSNKLSVPFAQLFERGRYQEVANIGVSLGRRLEQLKSSRTKSMMASCDQQCGKLFVGGR